VTGQGKYRLYSSRITGVLITLKAVVGFFVAVVGVFTNNQFAALMIFSLTMIDNRQSTPNISAVLVFALHIFFSRLMPLLFFAAV
jgi:hypothetical protein